MADKILNTRIALKIDTLEAWGNSTLPLRKGEIAIATVASAAGTELSEPVVMIKIGEDGVKTFKDLPWNFYAKASDVLSACKSEAGLTAFVNGVIADAGIASSDAMEALAGRVATVEGAITTLNGDESTAGSVAKAIKDAIDALDLANTYATKEHEHTKEDITDFAHTHTVSEVTDFAEKVEAYGYATKTEAQGYADAKDDVIAEAKKAGTDAAEALATHISEADAKYETKTDANNKLTEAKGYTDTEVGKVSALVGTLPDGASATTVVGYIDAKTANIASDETVGAIDDRVAAIEEDYLKDADKTELQGQITTNANAIERLTNGVSADEIDGVNDLINYVNEHGTEVTGMKADIAANTKAIEDHEALAAETYETKTDASSKLTEAKNYANGLNTAMDTRVKALEAIEHDAYVAADTALKTELQGKIDAIDNHSHSNKTELDKIADGDVAKWNAAQANAEATAAGALATARTEISAEIDADVKVVNDALEAYKTANDAEVAKKANDDDLAAIAKTGSTDDLVQGSMTLVFDCGNSVI